MIRYFIPAILWFIISTILLTLPGSTFPSDDWLGRIHFDKFVHICMFALMTFLLCWGFYKNPGKPQLRKLFFMSAAVSLAFGIIMEFVQRDFIPNRSFDSGDILADAAGAAAGLIFSLYRFIKK